MFPEIRVSTLESWMSCMSVYLRCGAKQQQLLRCHVCLLRALLALLHAAAHDLVHAVVFPWVSLTWHGSTAAWRCSREPFRHHVEGGLPLRGDM